MRTCAATSTKLFVIGPLSFELNDKSLKRAGMDYINELTIQDTKKVSSIEEFKNKNIFYITRYSENIYTSANFSNIVEDTYLMFGRESTGIPHDILRANLSKTLRIPMSASARSLNLSNSVAIVLYEVLRQQKFYGLATKEEIKGNDFLIKEKD